jgi:hypothetical protein
MISSSFAVDAAAGVAAAMSASSGLEELSD